MLHSFSSDDHKWFHWVMQQQAETTCSYGIWIQLSKTELKLEKGSLLHDPEELLLIDLAITVSVSLINHFLQTKYLLNVTESES